MAGENKNTGPANLGGSGTADSAKKYLRDLIDDQGDYNNLLKNAIKDLERTDSAYAKIEARIASLSRDTINVKEINQEIYKLSQKEYLEKRKLVDLEKFYGTEAVNALKTAKEKTSILMEEAKILGEQVDYEETLRQYLQDAGNLEAVKLYSQEQQIQIAKEKIQLAKQEVEEEKKLRKDIGYTGAAFKIFADKLGIGNEFYGKMVEKARKLNDEGKKLTFFDKAKGLASAAAGGAFEALTDPLVALPIAGVAIAGIAKGLKTAFDYIVGTQDQTVKFARAMNVSTIEARKLKMEFASLSVASGDLFITSQKMVESQIELNDALDVTNSLDNEILATNIKLKDIAGLEAGARSAIAASATITGRSSEGITKSILSQVAGLKQTTGLGFQYQKILKEAASFSGVLGLQFAKYPDKLTKSLVTVKSMGLELSKLDSMADSFLDFESSISKEFEAQLLTGKDINLAKAREAFLNNDLATAAAEITKQTGNANDFLKMNRIQQDAISAALGMSRDDMATMLKQQELFTKLGAKDLKDAQAKVQALKAQGKTREEIAALTGEEAYQSLVNASAQEKIAAFIDKIKQSFADFIETSGIVEKIESFVNYLSKPENIRAIIEGMRTFFGNAVEFIGTAAHYILEGLDYVAFGQIPDSFIDSIKSGAQNMGAQIRSLGGDLSGIGVGANRANTEAGGYSATVDNMAMRRGAATNVNVMVNNVNDVNGRTLSNAVVETTYADGQTGAYAAQSGGQ